MAISHSKRSIHRAQPAHRFVNTVTTSNPVTTPKASPDRIVIKRRQQVFQLPEVKGKVMEDVQFVSSSDYDVISLTFRDKTVLDFVIETCFAVHADYLDRKSGDRRVLKTWPLMHKVRFRNS